MTQNPGRTDRRLWQQYVVVMSVAAAIAVLTGVVLMFHSAEETDREPVAQAQPRVEQDARSKADDVLVAPSDASLSAPREPLSEPPPEAVSTHERDDEPNPAAATTAAPVVPKLANEESAVSPSAAAAPPSSTGPAAKDPWLKLNENGEPVEATLANGAVIALPRYGDGYDGYDWRPPVSADKAETVIDYQRLRIGGAAAGMLNVDAEHGKLYWMDGDFAGRVANIRSASLDGRGFRTIRNLHGAGGLKFNAARQEFYWVANDEDGGKAIQRAKIGVDAIATIVSGLKQPKIAIDSDRSKLYYFDDVNVVRCDLDGGNETRLLVTEHPGGTAVVDPRTGTVYWAGGGPGVDALAVGDARPKEIVNVGNGRGLGHINSIAVDAENGQIYWNNATYGSIRRANADGSEIEDIVIGAVGVNAVAIDSKHRFLYWMQNLAIDGSGDVLIRRTRIPPPLVRSKKPAPPFISSIEPRGGAPGSELRLAGAHLANATSVIFIANKNTARATAEITVSGDTELVVTVPKLAPQASETSIVVANPGGITFTLPRASQRIERLGSPESAGFTQFDRFATGPQSFVLASGGHFARVENALIYSEQASVLDLGERGADTCFLKNGAELVVKNEGDNWIFHEPFALIEMRDRADSSTRFIPVPAIRPSVVDTLFLYQPAKPGGDWLPERSAAASADAQSGLAAITGPEDKSPPVQQWLRINETGEPYEVTLADGTVLKLDVYGDEYEGHDYRTPMPAAKGDILIDYRRLRWHGLFGGGIRLDLKHRKMYWGDTLRGPHPSSIRRASLNGSHIETVIDRDRLRPSDFILHVDDSMIYWVNSGLENGEGRSIECADFAGSRRQIIVEPISITGGIALDAKERKLYYVDGDSIIRCGLDGSDQTRVVTTRKPGTLLVDAASRTIYWTKNMHMIRKASLDGDGECDAVNIGEFHGHITRAALDANAGKLYWTHSNPGRIQRANLDGSQIEDVVVGDVTFSGLDLDTENGHMYWTENFPDEHGEPVTLVRRATVRPSPAAVTKPAPALIREELPDTIVAGGTVRLKGSHFTHTKTVVFVDDGSGAVSNASFTVKSDTEISVVVPRMSRQCRKPVIVVEGAGGVTVTLPRSARIARRDAVDRFHPNGEFAYVVPASGMIEAERAVVFAMQAGGAYSGAHGQNTFFVKNGAFSGAKKNPNNRIYFEPFALVSEIEKPGPGSVLVPCAAIRPGFLEKLPDYKETEEAAR